jgi:hypothetical protein
MRKNEIKTERQKHRKTERETEKERKKVNMVKYVHLILSTKGRPKSYPVRWLNYLPIHFETKQLEKKIFMLFSFMFGN